MLNLDLVKIERFGVVLMLLVKIENIFFLFFACFTFLLLLGYWYFIATFCAVYENTQIIFIKDSITSFALNLFYPLLKYLFFTFCRVISLKDRTKKNCNLMYKLGSL